MGQIISPLVATLVRLFARFITAVRGIWDGVAPVDKQRIYYANHASHGDFILVWTALPPPLRRHTRPVAGADYWLNGRLRSWLIRDVFKAVLVDRNADTRQDDPIETMSQALHSGDSLILFPEGTRNLGDQPLQPFKSGLFHLAQACPEVELVPVWIANLNRVMPKGEFVPIPLICTVTFGEPVALESGEDKAAFLARASSALERLSPDYEPAETTLDSTESPS
ncbi:lysophospholipid acyltransferase family protein [Halomonas halocynthiae]|uniref:lysophospholipid acyltransferase family protein n=1 Tax=Halomonas halocynthiae TaxID=176290 RepID=UPI0003FA7667|nr:lysophospholipid acyltransferase family protein [Halomonas halocynthiae]